MAANLFQPSLSRALDSNGNPVNGAKMYFYVTGTTTPATWYTDQAGTIAGTSPLTSNSAGLFAPAYLNPDTTYRIILKTNDEATVLWDVDPVRGFDETQVGDDAAAAQLAATNAATAQAAAEAAQAEAEAAQAAAEAAETGAAAAVAFATDYYPGARSYVPQGAVTGAGTITTAGSGGTDGTFALAFSSGNFAVNPTGTFTVSGGAVTAITITGPGLYIGNAISKPTLSFAASTGLTGAAGTFNTVYLKTAGQYYLTDHATDSGKVSLFQNQANAATQVSASLDPFSVGAANAARDRIAHLSYLVSQPFANTTALNAYSNAYLTVGDSTIIPGDGRYAVASLSPTVWTRTGDSDGKLAADSADAAATEASLFTDVRAAVEGAGLPYPTEYETEAETYFAAAATAGSARGDGIKYVVNRWIKKWKDAGIWDDLVALWVPDNTLAVSRINIKNPGTYNLIDVGSGPTFVTMRVAAGATINTSTTGFRAASTSSYLNTQIPLNSLSQNDFHIGLFGRVGSASATYTFGVGDGTAGLGLNIANNGNGSRPTARAMGTECLAPAPTSPMAYSTSGLGFTGVQRRNDAANVEFIHNGIIKGTVASASVAPTVSTTLKLGVASGITSGASSCAVRAAWVFSRGLTESELDLFYRGVRSIVFAHHFGAVSIRPAGVAPSKVSADVVVYGWTLQGVIAAYEAARQGLDVALVGGWDDHTLDDLGGVSSNGLGLGDIKSTTALGGVMKAVLDRIPQVSGSAGTTSFAPAYMNLALRELLDTERTSVSGSVALYETGGVLSAEAGAISDDRILHSMRCEDGTTFEAEYFIDCTYEGDLAGVSGVTMTWGTDAAGTGLEIPAGFVGRRAEQTSYGAAGGQPSVGSTEVFLDPYVTPGDPTSGLLYSVKADGGWVKGQAMKTVQNYCFRQTFVNNATLQRPLPTSAPAGYDATKFQVQERYFSTAAGLGLTPGVNDLFIPNGLPGGYQDFNNRYFLSLDIQESGTRFVQAATYNARRKLKDEYLAYTDELIYHFWASPSSAIPAATRTALQGYSYAVDHYLDPGPNDQAYKSSTLYVREARRIVGELVWDANDLAAADGTVPRSTKTVACASYDGDSHVHFLFVDTSTATTQIYGANKLFINTAAPNNINGVNKLAPLPREIFLPVREEVANLAVIFAGSWTHVAHGSIRMEFTSAQAAQSFGMLCAIAHENDIAAFMDVDDDEFRTRMAALPETTPAYLPQVN